MTRQRLLAGLVGLMIIATVTGFFVDRDKRLTIWLAKRLHNRQQMVPLLLGYYKNGDRRVKDRVLKTFARLDESALKQLVEVFRTGDPASQSVAAAFLTDVGAPAANALIALLNEDDPLLSARAAGVLIQAREKAAPSLQNAIGNPDRQVRWWVVTTLGKIGPGDPTWVETLNAILTNDADVSVRTAAAAALGEMGSAAKAHVPDLVIVLGHEDPGLRAAAARALGRIGTADPEALAHLTVALTDEDPFVRDNAWAAMMTLQAAPGQ